MKSAIILAGGKGERLRPYTETRPKAMVEISGKPMISYVLNWLSFHGFERVIICCGYRHEILTDYCGDGTSFKLQVEYLIEDTPIGRGGAIRSAMHYLGPTPNSVLALNGDIITNLNPNDVLSHHARSNVLATLVSVPLVTQYGIVEIGEHSLVKSFCEKPELPYWINAGIYAFAPGMQSLLPDVGDHEVETFPALAKQGQLAVFTTRSFWRAVDTVKDLTEIEAKFENGYSQIGSQS